MNDEAAEIEVRTAQLVLLDQQLALGAYLQALLRPEPVEPVEQPQTSPLTEPVREPSVETGRDAAPAKPSDVTEPVASAPAEAVAASPQPSASLCPDWAQGRFQCLMFRVAGLTLALPLAKLNGVLPWDTEAVTELPNHQPWFLGLRTHLEHKVKLIDVANVVLPADRWAELPPVESGRLGKVILIDDGHWGLACDDVAEVITLSGTDVKWRSQSGSRPWLAGTVIKQMCALIDTDSFAEMLRGSGPAAI